MAELAASIIGIVSAGTKVSLILSQLTADVGSAGKEARMIGSDIRSFCTVLNTLGTALDRVQSSRYYAHCAELISDMTYASMEMFTEILEASEELEGMAMGKDGKHRKFGFVERVQWAVFRKPRIMVLRAAIEAYKSNLALMLHTLNTAEKVNRPRSTNGTLGATTEEENDMMLLQSFELEYRASMIDLQEVEHQYQESLGEAPPLNRPEPISQQSDGFQNPLEETHLPGANSLMKDLIDFVRQEVESTRLSISQSSVSHACSTHSRVSQHSERLSLLMADDRNRISQRWSIAPSTLSFPIPSPLALSTPTLPTHLTPQTTDAPIPRNPSFPENTSPFLTSDTHKSFYARVVSWLRDHNLDERVRIMESLTNDALDNWSFAPPALGLPDLEPISHVANSTPSNRIRQEGNSRQRTQDLLRLFKSRILGRSQSHDAFARTGAANGTHSPNARPMRVKWLPQKGWRFSGNDLSPLFPEAGQRPPSRGSVEWI